MTFPVTWNVFGWEIAAHPVLETVAYLAGSQLFLWQRRRLAAKGALPKLAPESAAWLVFAMLAGAGVGAVGLDWVEHLPQRATLNPGGGPLGWIAGKTIVGGILGGWVGIEIAKKVLRISFSTGDLFVLPLAAGIAIGRIGCFLMGLEDGTYGIASNLPWAVDFGDGVARHPTQLYEMVFVVAIALVLHRAHRSMRGDGREFRAFVGTYLVFRVAIEFIKPVAPLALGLSAIQWASLVGAIACTVLWIRTSRVP